MFASEKSVYIIGAGISGLVAAIELEKVGYFPVILEASDGIGGRVKTVEAYGYLLDQGFQVLLTAYPELSRYLDLDKLNLKKFKPGAIIFEGGEGSFAVHDPLRNPLKLFSMAFSKVGTVWDKYKMYALTKKLKEKSIEEIFDSPQQTTLAYLEGYGFSKRIVHNFFKPFFSGIFLEDKLSTSSAMFEFVFKMFGEGYAAIPQKGMGEISQQLYSQLEHTQVRFQTKVSSIEKNTIHLESGNQLTADQIIIATAPNEIVGKEILKYNKVTNLYFTLQQSFIGKPMIGLVPDEQYLINNFVFMTDVSKSYSSDGRALLSVSIIKDVEGIDSLENMIAKELEALTGINANHFEHVKTFSIDKALPILSEVKNTLPLQHVKLYDNVYLAGDHLLNGSINAAMTSGRLAAKTLMANDS
ncbi:protoporphyrinogen/coproporphyrinogen oxidase [Cyclobacterium marinum]|uniref:Amine oxidase n=1 Tax=Cyclobacterium marinum (strain ATCC 25205 / DSM 745 / LMG 13164 / NCIMB 1802) TaxID=880070 RepID=G0J5I6_CYCMS|nr:NAD(P)/FAD-dependent oxidoreductase [Cyclobacterium marinum]AEL28435.1 amine oxidase [Cyclobacterium marinum DSM 745]